MSDRPSSLWWIPVEAAKPEDGERVLTLLLRPRFGIPEHIDEWDAWMECWKFHNNSEVTHWARFPQLPPLTNAASSEAHAAQVEVTPLGGSQND